MMTNRNVSEYLELRLHREGVAQRQEELVLVLDVLERNARAHEHLDERREAKALWKASEDLIAAHQRDAERRQVQR